MNKHKIWALGCVAVLSACSSTSQKPQTSQSTTAPIVDLRKSGSESAAPATNATGGAYLAGDGPGADVPANLDSIPDAVPKAEPLHRYANRTYSALGKSYTPLSQTGSYKERGIASWYGKKFHGQLTSIGEVYDMYGMTAAHPTLPVPSYARVTSVATGKSVVVRVNDRGPFLHGRIMDLSYVAAYKLGFTSNGSAEVDVESIAVDGEAPVVSAVETAVVSVESVTVVNVLPVETAATSTSVASVGTVFLQLGAFKARQGAESFLVKMRTALGEGSKTLSLSEKDDLTRVRLGPYANVDEARRDATRLISKLGFKPFVSLH
jgi:rare lipoprotein A